MISRSRALNQSIAHRWICFLIFQKSYSYISTILSVIGGTIHSISSIPLNHLWFKTFQENLYSWELATVCLQAVKIALSAYPIIRQQANNNPNFFDHVFFRKLYNLAVIFLSCCGLKILLVCAINNPFLCCVGANCPQFKTTPKTIIYIQVCFTFHHNWMTEEN